MDAPALEALAQRLFDAFVAHDLDQARSMMRPDAVIIQNGVASTVDEALTNIASIRSILGDHRYTNVRRVTGVNAVVEEHNVISTTPAGAAVDLSACVVFRVDGEGLIREVVEYVDLSNFPFPGR